MISIFATAAGRLRGWATRATAPGSPAGGQSARLERHRRFRIAAAGLLIFATAFAVRLMHWQDAQAEIDRGEALITALARPYQQEARRMIEEGRMLYPSGPPEQGDARMIIHPPGYSILMASVLKAGGSHDSLRLAQVVCDSLAAVLVYVLALSLFQAGPAAIAGLLAAASPHLAHYALWLTPESLAVAPLLLAALFMSMAAKRPRLWLAIAAGVMVGLSCWLRSNGLLLAPFLAAASLVLFERKVRWRYAVAIVASAAVVISPITIRNWIVYERFIPLSLGAGITLIEGIAEYDKEGRFGLPATDREAALKDGEWHGRPDYALNLWRPDGVWRERARLSRGLAVVRENPMWFLGVMLDRAFDMLRYNDSFGHGRGYHIASIALVSPRPPFGHRLRDSGEARQVFAVEPADLVGSGQAVSPRAEAFVDERGRAHIVAGESSGFADQFASAPLALKENTDYLLEFPAWQIQGPLAAKVTSADRRISLASRAMRAAGRDDNDKGDGEDELDIGDEVEAAIKWQQGTPVSVIRMPFASGQGHEALLVISNNGPAPARPAIQLGPVALLELGPTPNQWTRPVRPAVYALQKNLFKTTLLLPLVAAGMLMLALGRRFRALLLLFSVPLYFLSLQSALHTEYRYILAIHYFLFILAGISVFAAVAGLYQLARHSLGRASRRGAPPA